MTQQADQKGIILINVLAVLAIASMAVLIMVSMQERGTGRSIRFAAAAQADAYSHGAEASAVIALRRDLQTAPDSDHLGEAWAQIQDDTVDIENGSFSIRISDAQSKYNINNIAHGLQARQVLSDLLTILEADEDTLSVIEAYIATAGEAKSLDNLRLAGLDADEIDKLSPHLTALPEQTNINLNTASRPVLTAFFDNTATSNILIGIRDRKGYLDKADINQARTLLPAGAGFTSSYYTVTTQVTLDETSRRMRSLLQRRDRDVKVIRRIKEMAAPQSAAID